MEPALHAPDILPILMKCILVFGVAGLIVPIFNRIHISPVLGFLACGVILSPHALGAYAAQWGILGDVLIVNQSNVMLLGELGVLALLFMIGLDLSFEKLSELRRYIFGLGTAQIGLTGAVICFIAYVFGNPLQTSIVLGVGFALSSTAIVMQSLKEMHLEKKPVGRLSFSILLMQDMAVVPILIMISIFTSDQSGEITQTPALLGLSLLIAVIAVAAVYFIGKRVLQPILHSLIGTNKNEWLAAFSLFVLCLLATFTYKIGLSAALGAFLAGLLIAETEFHDRIEEILYPLKSVLLGVFFIAIGMSVNVVEVLSNPIWLSLSVIGIFCVKAMILYPLARSFGIPHHKSSSMTVLLSQPGEFTLMVISVSFAAGLLGMDDAQFFLLVTVLGMLITPFVARLVPYFMDKTVKA